MAGLALAAVALPARSAGRAPAIAPDPVLTAGLASIDLASTAPPYQLSEFDPYRNATAHSTVDGRLVRPTTRGYVAVRGANVFLVAARPYTAWVAALATANARGYTDNVASIDHPVREYFVHRQTTDGTGRFTFTYIPGGAYYLFADLNMRFGPAAPADRIERGWDGNGHGADVTVPGVDVPQGHLDQFVYLYGYDLPADRAPWNLGLVKPSSHYLDGKPMESP